MVVVLIHDQGILNNTSWCVPTGNGVLVKSDIPSLSLASGNLIWHNFDGVLTLSAVPDLDYSYISFIPSGKSSLWYIHCIRFE